MARARNIKPGFFQNEFLPRTEALGRLLFIGLWTLADRDGRLEDRPMRIKAQLFPYEECDTDRYLCELQALGFLIRYKVEGKQYIQILNFDKHQNPHRNETPSVIPLPTMEESARVMEESAHADSLISDSLNPELKDSVSTPVDTPLAKCAKANGIHFERFWEHWPVKRNKAKAKQAFVRKKFDIEDVDDLIKDVENRKQHDPQWKRGFIPHCSTYLNGERWEDDYDGT